MRHCAALRGLWRLACRQIRRQAAPTQRRAADAALADDLGRHALVHLALCTAVDDQREVGVRVQIDEPGRHDQAAHVQTLPRGSRREIAQGDDAAVGTPTSCTTGSLPVPSWTVPPKKMVSSMEFNRG